MKASLILFTVIYFVACSTPRHTALAPKTDENQTSAATVSGQKIKKEPEMLLITPLEIHKTKTIKKDTPVPTETKIPEKIVDARTPKAIEGITTTKTEIQTIKKQDNIITTATQLPELKKDNVSHEDWNTLLQKHVSTTGAVNYKGFIKDKVAFDAYLKILYTNVPSDDWSVHQKLAYWMNTYNAFTIKLITDNYPLKSIKDLKDPWDQRLFKIGKKWYNLNEIEHQILRKMGDPRIHFGINCASFSCPPLLNKAFTPDNVEALLEQLAIAFVNDTQRNTITVNSIQISKIFQWFAKDFKTNGTLIHFLNQYAKTKIAPNAKKSFAKYNWTLNE